MKLELYEVRVLGEGTPLVYHWIIMWQPELPMARLHLACRRVVGLEIPDDGQVLSHLQDPNWISCGECQIQFAAARLRISRS